MNWVCSYKKMFVYGLNNIEANKEAADRVLYLKIFCNIRFG